MTELEHRALLGDKEAQKECEVIGYIDDYKLKQCQKTYCQNCGQKINLSEVAK